MRSLRIALSVFGLLLLYPLITGLGSTPVAVPVEVQKRYDQLIDKRLQTKLTATERDALHRLEAEMDGSDYAAHQPDDSWLEACEAEQRASRQRMDFIGNKIVDLA